MKGRLSWVKSLLRKHGLISKERKRGKLSAEFVAEESTQSVMKCIYNVVLKYGTFIDLYTDRASHFAYTPDANGKVGPRRPTQFSVALKDPKSN